MRLRETMRGPDPIRDREEAGATVVVGVFLALLLGVAVLVTGGLVLALLVAIAYDLAT